MLFVPEGARLLWSHTKGVQIQ